MKDLGHFIDHWFIGIIFFGWDRLCLHICIGDRCCRKMFKVTFHGGSPVFSGFLKAYTGYILHPLTETLVRAPYFTEIVCGIGRSICMVHLILVRSHDFLRKVKVEELTVSRLQQRIKRLP